MKILLLLGLFVINNVQAQWCPREICEDRSTLPTNRVEVDTNKLYCSGDFGEYLTLESRDVLNVDLYDSFKMHRDLTTFKKCNEIIMHLRGTYSRLIGELHQEKEVTAERRCSSVAGVCWPTGRKIHTDTYSLKFDVLPSLIHIRRYVTE